MTTSIIRRKLRTIIHPCIRQSSTHTPTLQDNLRKLMVHCAQPVGLVTTRLKQPVYGGKDNDDTSHEFHGATISSFSSIAMHPYPLVAFSLQLPSRMAHALHTRHHPTSSNAHPHFVINLLSTAQVDIAKRFSKPDLYPHPFSRDGMGSGRMREERLGLTQEGQPMLKESIGSISCAVVHSMRLDGGVEGTDEEDAILRTSELFIARVMRIELLNDGEERMPLVYFRKEYTTTDLDSAAES